MSESIGSGVTITIPVAGEQGWDKIVKTALTALCDHDHTGSGDGSPLSGDAFSANGIGGDKIRFANDVAARWRNAANSADIDAIKVNTSDEIEFATSPLIPNDDFLLGRNNADSANVSILKLNTDDEVEFGKSPLIPNNDYFLGKNNAGSGSINVLKVNASDEIEFGKSPLIPNNDYLMGWNNAGSSGLNMVKVNASNALEFGITSIHFASSTTLATSSNSLTRVYSRNFTSDAGASLEAASGSTITFNIGGSGALQVTSGGYLKFLGTHSGSAADPTSDAPDGFFDCVTPAGTTVVIPYYTKS